MTDTGVSARTMRAGAPAIRHIGREPNVETLLVGALLWAGEDTARDVIADLDETDLDDPHLRPILATARSLITAGTPHNGQAVGDELLRTGQLAGHAGQLTARCLYDAVTCGAQANSLAPRAYACSVVADAYRRRVELAGKALVEDAADAPEDDLWPRMRERGLEIAAHEARLKNLREGMSRVRA